MHTLIIHVGMGKTGSTAIQQALRAPANAAPLRAEGVFCCDHWLLAPAAGPHGFAAPDELVALLDTDPEAAAARLAAILDPANPAFAGATRIIWSNESLAARWEAIGPAAARLAASGHDVRIVIYFRHQADWLVSAYLQWCVREKVTPGRVMDFQQFCAEQVLALDYPAVMRNWTERAAPARVIPRAYEPGADVLADFCAVAGIETALAGAGARIYATPGRTAHALFRIVNDQNEGPSTAEDLLACLAAAGLLGRDFHVSDPTPLDIGPEFLAAIDVAYSRTNARLAEQYGITLNRGAPPALLGRRPGAEPVNTDLIAALAAMLGHLHGEGVRLRERIARLETRLTALETPRPAAPDPAPR